MLGWAGQGEQQPGLWGCRGGVEQGSLMWAGSLPPPFSSRARCCAALGGSSQWAAAASLHLGSPGSSPSALFSLWSLWLLCCCFLPFPAFPLLSPQLSQGIVLRNNMHTVESQALMVTWCVCHALRAQCGGNLSPLGARWPCQVSLGHEALKAFALPSPVSKLKVAPKQGYQPSRKHGLSSSCAPA